MKQKILYLISVMFFMGGCTLNTSQIPIQRSTQTPVDINHYLVEAAQMAETEDFSAALNILTEASQLDTTDLAPVVAMGKIYVQQHRWELAQETFENILEQDNDNYVAILGLAEALLAHDKVFESRALWQHATTLDEVDADAWVGLGRTYLAKRDFPEAKQAFIKALTYAPNSQALWFLAALTIPTDFKTGFAYLTEMENASPSQTYLKTALEPFNAESPPAEIAALTGIAFIQLDEWELAYYALNIARQLAPEQAQTLAFLGHTQATLGLPAMETFYAARNLEPTLALTPYFEGIYFRKQEQYDLAIERFSETIRLDPGNLAAGLEMAFTQAEKGDYYMAELWYKVVAATEPESVEYQTLLTAFYVEQSYKVNESGLAEAERLVELAPDDTHSLDLLGWARFQTGDYVNAEIALRQSINLDPDNISARYHLGRLLESLNQHHEAEIQFNYVINQDISGVYRDYILKGN